jgi:hypothetical protein
MGRTPGMQGAQETFTEFLEILKERYHLREGVINKRKISKLVLEK